MVRGTKGFIAVIRFPFFFRVLSILLSGGNCKSQEAPSSSWQVERKGVREEGDK